MPNQFDDQQEQQRPRYAGPRANTNDVIQKTCKPNIGGLGIVRSLDDLAITCLSIPTKVGSVAETFTLQHGEYAIIGKSFVTFPKDPPPPSKTSFLGRAKKPEFVDQVVAATPVRPVGAVTPQEAIQAPQPAQQAPQPMQQAPQPDVIGGIRAVNNVPMPGRPMKRRPFQPPTQ